MAASQLLLLPLLLLLSCCSGISAQATPCNLTGDVIGLSVVEAAGTVSPLPSNDQRFNLSQIGGIAVATEAEQNASTFILSLRNDSARPEFVNDVSFNWPDYFRIEVADGMAYLVLTQGIDRERVKEGAEFGFIVFCTAGLESITSRSLRAEISLQDVNDNRPLFYLDSDGTSASPKVNFAGTVAENTPPLVLTFSGVTVRDADLGNNARVQLSIVQNGSYFQLVERGSVVRIYTAANIDYEALDVAKRLTAVVVATDQSSTSAQLSSNATVVFTVTDVDDQPPKFQLPGCFSFRGGCVDAQYSASVVSGVNSSSPLNILPAAIVAVDQDTLNFTVNYTFINTTYSDYFNIDPVTAAVTQLIPIDRRVASSVKLVVLARESSSRTDVEVKNLYETSVLTINVLSADTQAPTLSLNLPAAQLFVRENSPVGTRVMNANGTELRIAINDSDLVPTDPARKYSFSVTSTSLFAASEDGTVFVNSNLIDYDALTDKNISVTVSVTEIDSSITNRSSTVTFLVKILDQNDNRPIFNADSYSFVVSESAGGVSAVGSVSATDIDSGVRGSSGIRFNISSGNTSIFSINDTTGQLTASGQLLRGQTFVLTVRATDSEPIASLRQAADVTVTVRVASSLNLPPYFPAAVFTASISEATPIGDIVSRFAAIDPEGATLSYAVVNQSVANAFNFSSSADLLVAALLDRENASQISVFVAAQDALLNRTAVAEIRITLLDSNDNNPILSATETNVSITENTLPVNVSFLTATDADLGANALMEFLVMEATNSFTISQIANSSGSASAQLQLSKSLDFESARTHIVTVIARDFGATSRSGTVSITVNVVDADDWAPIFNVRFYSAALPESAAVGTDVATVQATDPDSSPAITYRLVTTSVPFTVNASTGVITTTASLDYESIRSYTLVVSTQQSGLTANDPTRLSATVTVRLTDVNDNNPVVSTSPITVIETDAIGTNIGIVNATDADSGANAEIQFSISGSSPAAGASLFGIDAVTGNVTVRRSLLTDRSVTAYNLSITASDYGNPLLSSISVLSITVTRGSNAPVIVPGNQTIALNVSIATGAAIGSVAATDADTVASFNSPLRFATAGTGRAPDYFSINPSTGAITLARNFTTDTATEYVLIVTATDPIGLIGSGTVTLQVARNLNAPTLTPATQSLNVAVDATPGFDIGASFSAGDADMQAPYNTFTYQLTSNQTVAANYFLINSVTGRISLRRSLVGQSVSMFYLFVTARDAATPSRTSPTAVVVVSVVPNAGSPSFGQAVYSVQVAGTAVNAAVANIVATDAESSTLTYSLYGTYAGLFEHNGTHLIAKGGFDNASVPLNFNLLLEAADSGRPPNTNRTEIQVQVLRNFNSPQFNASSYEFFINETQELGLVFGSVAGFDLDARSPENSIEFTSLSDVVGVNSNGGVYLQQMVMPGTETVYNITLQINDKGQPQQNTTVQVIVNVRRNQAAPIFQTASMNLSLPMTQAPGVIATVFANDSDPVFSSRIVYSLIGDSDAASYFSVNSVTGEVSLTASVAAQTATQYQLRISAADNGTPQLTSQSIITISISRNLYDPEILNSSVGMETRVAETQQLGVTVAQLVGRDNDSQTPYNQFDFELVSSGIVADYFAVSSAGSVYVKRSLLLDVNRTVSYLIEARARDRGNPSRTSAATFTVNVTVIRNYFAPIITNTALTITITSSSPTGTSIFNVTATDSDEAPFNTVTYSLLGSAAAVAAFEINATTGEITTRAGLAAGAQTSFVLTVVASDSGRPALTNVTEFTVNIRRNLNAPIVFMPSGPSFAAAVNISELTGVDSVIYTVFANDSDTAAPYNTIRYSLLGNSQAQTYFSIDATSGNIRVRQPLTADLSKAATYQLTISASDSAAASQSAAANISITINVQRNLQPPIFVQSVYRFSVIRSISVNSFVGRVNATDADTELAFKSIRFYLVSDGYPSNQHRFNISSEGSIFIARSLQADLSVTNYSIVVGAADGGVPSQTQTAIVIVTVERNLNAPVSYAHSFVVKETELPGFLIGRLNSTDADTGLAGSSALVYSFTAASAASPAGSLFFLSRDGRLFVQAALNAAADLVYELNFTTSDNGISGSRTSEAATISITMQRNQFQPELLNLPATITMLRNATVNSVVFSANASDNDSLVAGSPPEYSQLAYSIIGDSDSSVYFSIVPSNGTVSLQRALTGSSSSYTIRVRAADAGVPAKFVDSTILVNVTSNFAAPTITSASNGSIVMFASIGSDTGAGVVAVDPDTASSTGITYSIEPNDYFNINSTSGRIVTKAWLLGVSPASFEVVVYATDSGSLRSPATTLTILIERNTAAPVWTNTPTNSLSVNADIVNGAQLVALRITDADSNSFYRQLRAELVGDYRARQLFTVQALTQNATGLDVIITVTDQILNDSATEYFLQLRATDSAGCSSYSTPADCVRTARSADTFVTVRVNRNLQLPQFRHASALSLRILETATINVPLLVVNATEARTCVNTTATQLCLPDPGTLGTITFTLTSPSAFVSDHFSLYSDSSTGQAFLSLKQALTNGWRNASSDTFSITASDGGGRSISGSITVNIDRNNFSPDAASNVSAVIDETLAVGSAIPVMVNGSDRDTVAPFNSLTYSISATSASVVYFGVAANGSVILRQSLADETQSTFTFSILTSDGGVPSLTATTSVTIRVNRNINSPIWVYPNTTVTDVQLSENDLPGTLVVTLVATDADTIGSSGVVRYRVTGSSSVTNCFYVNSVTGQLLTSNSLIAAACSSSAYSLTVTAVDQGSPQKSTVARTLNVTVMRNLFTPYFMPDSSVNVSVDFNAAAGSVIGRVLANDSDTVVPFNSVSLALIGDGSVGDYFAVDASSGNISFIGNLSLTDQTVFNLRIRATDGGLASRSNTTQTTINIIRSLHAPIISPLEYNSTLNERQSSGLIGVTVTATDADVTAPHNSISYAIVGTVPSAAAAYFSIDSSSGAVSLTRSLTSLAFTITSVNLTVTARDAGFPSLSSAAAATVVIDIVRVSRPAATEQQNISISVEEVAAVGFVFCCSFNVSVVDSVDPVEFSLVNSTSDSFLTFNEYFFLDPLSGLISVKKQLSGSNFTGLQLLIEAKDSRWQTQHNIQLTIIRDLMSPYLSIMNRPLTDTNIGTFNISALTTAGINITQIFANDTFRGSAVFSIVGVYPANLLVNLSASGQVATLFTAVPFAGLRARVSRYLIQLSVHDSFYPTNTHTRTFTFDVDWSPGRLIIAQPVGGTASLTVWEKAAVGSSINASLSVSQSASYGSLSYSIVAGSEASQYFYIDPISGDVRIKRSLLLTASNTLNLTLEVTDGLQPSPNTAQVQYNITVRRNAFGTIFTPTPVSPVNVAVSVSVGDVVSNVTAVDGDAAGAGNHTVLYELTGKGKSINFFAIDRSTGRISIKQSLANDTSTEYSLEVKAYTPDYPEPGNTTTIIIRVNRNLNSPRFTQPSSSSGGSFSAGERAAVGFLLFDFDAVDDDGDRLVYSMTSATDVSRYLYINPSSGQLRVVSSLLSLSVSSLALTVTATDNGSPTVRSASVNVTLNVIRDSSPPVFVGSGTVTSIQVAETAANGSVVGNVTATDPDRNASLSTDIQYELIGSPPSQIYFEVDSTSGLIRLTRSLQLGTEPNYTLIIRAIETTSGKFSDRTVVISVIRNPNAPTFYPASQSRDVYANTMPGALSFSVFANDSDAFDTVRYSIKEANLTSYFYVHPTSGAMYLIGNASTLANSLRLTVIATDNGTVSRSSESQISVTIVRSSRTLAFNPPAMTITVNSAAHVGLTASVGLGIFVNATSTDTVGAVSYTVNGLFPADRFLSVNSSSGELMLMAEPSLAATFGARSFVLRVQAFNTLFPEFVASTLVTVIINHNQNRPIIHNVNTSLTVPLNLPLGSLLFTVNATDADNNSLSYNLTDSTNRMYIDPVAGNIYLSTTLVGSSGVIVAAVTACDNSIIVQCSVIVNFTVMIDNTTSIPAFENLPNLVNISAAATAVGDTLFTARATVNSAIVATMTYSTMGISPAPSFFQVSPTSGAITLNRTLSADSSLSYQLILMAFDSAQPSSSRASATGTLTISVVRNLNPPRVDGGASEDSVLIDQSQAVGSVFYNLNGSDPDGDAVTFALGSWSDLFFIDPISGEVSLRRSIIERAEFSYALNITISDINPPQRSTHFTLTVNVTRDLSAPQSALTNYSVIVSENAAIDSSVIQLNVTDPDLRGSLVFELMGEYPAPTYFGVSASGLVRVRRLLYLDYLRRSFYALSIKVYDSLRASRSTTINIGVTVQRNMTGPVVLRAEYRQLICRSLSPGTVVIASSSLNVTSAANTTLTFAMVESTGSFSSHFSLDANTGDVTVASGASLSSWLGASTAVVSVTDNFGRTQQGMGLLRFSISSHNVTSPPRVVQPLSPTVSDAANAFDGLWASSPVNTTAFTVTIYNDQLNSSSSAVQADLMQRYSAGIVADSVAAAFFQVRKRSTLDCGGAAGSSSGCPYQSFDIVVARSLMEEPSLQLWINFTIAFKFDCEPFASSDSLSLSSLFWLRILRNNDTAAYSPSSVTVSAGSTLPIGSRLPIEVTISDATVSPQTPAYLCQLEALSSSGVNTSVLRSFVFIDPSTCRDFFVIRSLEAWPAGAAVVFSVTLTENWPVAMMQTTRSLALNVTINFLSAARSVMFTPSSLTLNVSDSTSVGSVIGSLVLSDRDLAGELVYSVSGISNAAAVFLSARNSSSTNDSTTVEVFLLNDLRRDSSDSYELSITGYDSAYPSDKAAANVTVLVLRNAGAPQFMANYSQIVSAKLQVGATVLTVLAVDLVDNDTVTYSLSTSTTNSEYFYMQSNTGELVLRKSLLLSSASSFMIPVIATDSGSPSQTATTTIALTILRNESVTPVFTVNSQTVNVSENAAVNFTVAELNATSDRSPEQIRFGAVGDGLATALFQVDNVTGVVVVRSSLRRETVGRVILRVIAFSLADTAEQATSTVTISILRNQNGPTFAMNEYNTTLLEQSPVGSMVFNFTATDANAGDVLAYSLVDNATNNDYFFIDASTGLLYLRKSLLTTGLTAFKVTVRVSDSGVVQRNAMAVLNIIVPRDAFSVVFNVTDDSVSIGYNQMVGTVFYTAAAFDVMRVSNLRYEIANKNNFYFGINASSGEVSVSTSLLNDTSNSQQYALNITCYELHHPQSLAWMQLTINVSRNLHPPQFNDTFYTFNVAEESSPGANVGFVSAFDLDTSFGKAETIRFAIVNDSSGMPANYFYINQLTGQLLVKSSLAAVTLSHINFTVTATDSGPNERSASVMIFTSITRQSSPSPDPGQSFTANISENLAISGFVYQIQLNNSASGVVYELTGQQSATLFFTVNASGAVLVARNLKEETVMVYNLTLIMYYSSGSGRKISISISINVRRNENGPIFSSSFYTFTVRPSFTPGFVVGTVNATDADMPFITYSLTATAECQNLFYVNAENGDCVLRQRLASLTAVRYVNCTIQASDNTPPTPRTASALVYMLQQPDATPTWSPSNSISVTIAEGMGVGSMLSDTAVMPLFATDADLMGSQLYSLIGNYPADQYFEYNATARGLVLRRSLMSDRRDTASYTIVLLAYDSMYTTSSSRATITVNVNRNANKPAFQFASYSASVLEGANIGEILQISNPVGANLTATDADNERISYSMRGSTATDSNYFYIQPEDARVSVKINLQQTTQNTFNFNVTATDSRGGEGFTTLTITVIRNDSRPQLPDSNVSIAISENLAVSGLVYNINATAAAEQLNIRYRIEGSSLINRYFQINNRSGEVTLLQSLKESTFTLLQFSIVAYSLSSSSVGAELASTTQLTVTILRNQNPPIFNPRSYTESVFEGIQVNTLVVSLRATDADNDALTYSMSGSSDAMRYFYVERTTGQVKLAENLPSFDNQTYSLNVTVSDNRLQPRTDVAVVSIVATTDAFKPYFVLPSNTSDYVLNIQVDQAPNVHIVTVMADKMNKSQALLYRTTGIFPATELFTILANGSLQLTRSLLTDNVRIENYTLQVESYDPASPLSIARLTIWIQVDLNPYTPQFSQPSYNVPVDELASPGTRIVLVNATDRIASELLTFEFGSSASAQVRNLFNLDSRSGLISLRSVLTGATELQYAFTVTVRDISKSNTVNVTVTVTRNLQTPQFHNLPANVTVNETAAISQIVFAQINATDPEGLRAITFELTGIDAAVNYFAVSSTGVVTVKSDLIADSSNAMQYVLRVVAVETGATHMRATASLTVIVNRNVNSPQFVGVGSDGVYNATVNQFDAIGTFLINVFANDSDIANNTRSLVTYSVSNSTDFYIHPTTGALSTAAKLMQERYVISVTASDSYQPSIRSTSAIVVINVNTNQFTPVFTSSQFTASISAAFQIGISFIQVNATDADAAGTPFSQITYSLSGNATHLAHFVINSANGMVMLRDTVLNVGVRVVNLTVTATDGGDPPKSSQASLLVNIIENVNATQFTVSEQTVEYPEDVALNSSIANVTAVDADAVGRIRYLIIGDGLSSTLFSIGAYSGRIALAVSFTTDTSIAYTIRCVAYDEGNPNDKAVALVHVSVIRNRNPPLLRPASPYFVSISESQQLGSTILQLNASDADSGLGGQLRFRIDGSRSEPSNVPAWFDVSRQGGALSVSRPLSSDSRQLLQYNVSVRVSDRGNPPRSESALIVVNVNRNRNRPRFLNSSLSITVNESVSIGSDVTRLIAVEQDNDTITYSAAGIPAVYFFDVRPNTGDLFVKYSPAFTTENSLQIIITASDGGSPAGTDQITVTINILRNPNAPAFTQPMFNFTVSEYAIVGSLIGSVRAVDLDPSNIPSGSLTYSLDSSRSSSASASLFRLGSSSAELTISNALWNVSSRSSPTYYTIGLTVTDAGSPARSSNATAFIAVVRNDHSPVFTQRAVNVTVTDVEKFGFRIAQLTAADADATLQPNTNNSIVHYSISSSSSSNSSSSSSSAAAYFGINANTGELTLKQMLANDPLRPGQYQFTVIASDRGDPVRSDNVSVLVNVRRTISTGGRQLGFSQPQYSVELEENVAIGSSVQVLEVLYKTSGSAVNCGISSGNDAGYFDVRPVNSGQDCQLVTKATVDRETVSRVDLQVSVSQVTSGRRRKKREVDLVRKKRQTFNSYATVRVTILLKDVNDNAPRFHYPVYPNVTSVMNRYFAAIDLASSANQFVIRMNATDTDEGRNAEVSYAQQQWATAATPVNPPFLLLAASGEIRTAATFTTESQVKYQFAAVAKDNGLPLQQSSATEIIVNLIQDKNRMILVVPGPGRGPEVTIPLVEGIRQQLQAASGQVILIEKVNPRQFLEGSDIKNDATGTDIWFVCVNPVTYDICVRDDSATTNRFMTEAAKSGIRSQLASITQMETIRPPFAVTTDRLNYRRTSDVLYSGALSSEVWISLVALAAIIILLSSVFIVYCIVKRPRIKLRQRFYIAHSSYGGYATSSAPASTINGTIEEEDEEEQYLEYNVAEDAANN